LRLWEVVATRITVIKIGVNDGSGNGTGSYCYRIGNSEFDEYDKPNYRLWRDMEFRMKR